MVIQIIYKQIIYMQDFTVLSNFVSQNRPWQLVLTTYIWDGATSSVTEEHGALRHILCRGPFSATFAPLLKNFFRRPPPNPPQPTPPPRRQKIFRSVYHFGSQKIFSDIPQFFLKTKIFFRKHLRCLLPLSMFIYCNTV